MKTSYRSRGRSAPAFTLVEIMVVIAIIAVLATMSVSGLGWYKRKADTGRTKVLIASIERALEDYKSDHGFYPQGDGGATSTLQVYIALYGDGELVIDAAGVVTVGTAPDGETDADNTVYLDILNPDLTGKQKNVQGSGAAYDIIDSWDNPLGYASPGVMNPANDFDLWSKGLNGLGYPDSAAAEDIVDDMKNW